MAAPEDDAAVPEAAPAEQEEADTASREPPAEEASAKDPEPASDAAVVEEPPDWTTHAFVDGNYYVLGNPEAEVSILDVGDFL